MIEIKQLRKRFRGRPVLQGIDLSIARGHRIALIGSNGAGKTTLIRCLLGEYRYEGQVLLDGADPRAQRQQVLAKVGFVPQLPPPLRMPVGQLIRFSSTLCQSDPAQIRSLAAELGFDTDKFRSQPFVKLSGGQKQKLLIAIALGREAEFLVMDEPAANLDPAARKVFFQILADKKERSAMLISSHRLDEVASLVNRVIELDQGAVILDDRVADLVDMSSSLSCQVSLVQAEAAFANAIGDWGFSSDASGKVWSGSIAGPDRLRFLALLSRYAALLAGIEMREQANGN
ncbi:MAG: ABC transporter ATP-binding protein [Gammaproteobacteria bacterium]|nr:ABC transporter ATP-binding protein [Gammaproteobacteria bacterium]